VADEDAGEIAVSGVGHGRHCVVSAEVRGRSVRSTCSMIDPSSGAIDRQGP
jgi:hypothetical protein